MHGTFRGKISTVAKDGKSHVAAVWFIVKGNVRYLKEKKGTEIYAVNEIDRHTLKN
jgi:hypothetical protein